jgi:hypothetical protein
VQPLTGLAVVDERCRRARHGKSGRVAIDGPHCPEPRQAAVESSANQLPSGITGIQRGGTAVDGRERQVSIRVWSARYRSGMPAFRDKMDMDTRLLAVPGQPAHIVQVVL